MNSKRIGNIGEAKVLSKFVELGIPVYIPFGDNEKADLIAEFNNKLNKIQVKTSQYIKNNKMWFSLASSTRHRKNGFNYFYTYKDIDYFACYNIERDKIYLLDINTLKNKTYITIRCNPTKNHQVSNVNYEDDFLIDNILCVETLHEAPKN